MALPMADLTATATLVLAAITLALVIATIALVVVTRAGTAQAQADAQAELGLIRRQIGAGYRPLLVDVLVAAPVPDDMGATLSTTTRMRVGGQVVDYPGPSIETKLPGIPTEDIDPRSVFVRLANGKIYISVPLRNVGRGLAVLDGAGVEIEGAGLGQLEHRTIQRYHVPVGETTRIDLIKRYRQQEPIAAPGEAWQLTVPYTDFAGEQRTAAKLQLTCRGDDAQGPWYVERVEQATSDTGVTPFA